MPSSRSCAVLALLVASCAAAPAPPASVAPARQPPPTTTPIARAPQTLDVAGDLAAKIDPIFGQYAKPGSPGCAVGVYRAGETLFARGYGYANLEYGVPIASNTSFETASLSKQFTAAAIELLVLDGKLTLDDDVRKYVPEVPVYAKVKPITLRHLLHHTSGLRNYVDILSFSGFRRDDASDDVDALFAIAHQNALNFPTGTEWSYSNTGYFLLSIVVKRVTGKSLSEFARVRLFEPLGMKSTFFLDDHMCLIPRRATGYEPGPDDTFGTAAFHWDQVGDGGLQTTIEDLARWDAIFYTPNDRVGGAALIQMLRTRSKLDDGTPLPTHALGVNPKTANGVPREDHSGHGFGFTAHLLRYPTERLTVAILCNVAPADPERAADAVAEALLPAIATRAASSSPPGSPDAHAPSPSAYTASPAELAAIVGAYYDPATYDVRTISLDHGAPILGFRVEAGGDHRQLVSQDARTLVVVPDAGGGPPNSTRYAFEPASRGAPAHLVRTALNQKTTTLLRFQPMTVAPSALAEYSGRYESDEVLGDWEVGVVDGTLRAERWSRPLISSPLRPLMRDVFVPDAGVSLRFERDARGRVSGFVFSQGATRGIRFVRRAPRPGVAPARR